MKNLKMTHFQTLTLPQRKYFVNCKILTRQNIDYINRVKNICMANQHAGRKGLTTNQVELYTTKVLITKEGKLFK